MTDHQRVARDHAEPPQSAAGTSELFAAYLDYCRETIIARVEALDADDRRRSGLPSGWTPIELLSHVLHMEQRWFVWGFLGEPVADPWGDWTVDEPWDEEAGGRWIVADDVGVADLVRRLRAIGERTRGVLRDVQLEATASPGGRFADDPPTLRWICFHVLQEYARHAGHLDIAVELAGGPTGE